MHHQKRARPTCREESGKKGETTLSPLFVDEFLSTRRFPPAIRLLRRRQMTVAWSYVDAPWVGNLATAWANFAIGANAVGLFTRFLSCHEGLSLLNAQKLSLQMVLNYIAALQGLLDKDALYKTQLIKR